MTADESPAGTAAGPDAGTRPGVAAFMSRGALALSASAGVAVVVVILGIAVALFFNPVWVAFEQGRSSASLWTAWDQATVRAVTDAVVIEVFAGPGTFAQAVAGTPVFTAAEAAHMADVRRVVIIFAAAVLVAVIALIAAWVVDRRRIAFWRGVGYGSAALGIGVVAVGAFLALFFDVAFEIFHRVFFAAGSYTFDPRTDRLVQLFPEAFWTETSMVLAGVVLALAIATAVLARWRRRAAMTRLAAAARSATA